MEGDAVVQGATSEYLIRRAAASEWPLGSSTMRAAARGLTGPFTLSAAALRGYPGRRRAIRIGLTIDGERRLAKACAELGNERRRLLKVLAEL
jgi:imidazolonepropionase-like amidohydrolase